MPEERTGCSNFASQMIMASRVLYGLADQGSLPAALARVSPRTRTPLLATAAVTLLVGVMAVGVLVFAGLPPVTFLYYQFCCHSSAAAPAAAAPAWSS